MDTEVVIWSSKVQHSPPPPTYDHAMWTMRTSHQQPGVSWVPQHEPEPIPVSSEVDFSSVTSLNRCANRVQCLKLYRVATSEATILAAYIFKTLQTKLHYFR